MRTVVCLLVIAMAIGLASAFQAPSAMTLRKSQVSISAARPLRRVAKSTVRMGKILESGEMELTDEECEKLKMPPNSVVPAESVQQFKDMIQEIDDEAIRTLARQIGTSPEEEPYPGYFEDLERLGLAGKDLTTSSANPASLYGPGGKAYAPWMVGKIAENVPKRERQQMSDQEKKFSFSSRGQELSGVGLSASLLGDEVRLAWTVEGEKNSKGYIVTKRPGGTEDEAYSLVADYQTPGAMLESGRINGEYSYVDGNVSPGVWVYRVQEEDVDGTKSNLSQTIIDIPSNEDKIKTLVAAGVLGAFLTGLTVISLTLDPQNGL